MTKTKGKNIVIKAQADKLTRLYGAGVTLLAFVALFLLAVSALIPSVPLYLSVIPGMCVMLLWTALGKNKHCALIVTALVFLYSMLCVSADAQFFVNGAKLVWNAIAGAINDNTAQGLKYAVCYTSGGGEFVFGSAVGVWLALAVSALGRKSSPSIIIIDGVELFVMMIVGLYPSPYTVVAAVVAAAGLLTVDRGMNIKSATCYLAVAASVFALCISCFAYAGSTGVKSFRASVSDGINAIMYGDDSLPDGKLSLAGDIHSSKNELLRVTVAAQTPTLYLKGFVGANLDGNEWKPTNKNLYVQNGYQGLTDYLAGGGVPVTQYAEYSSLLGNVDRYFVTVKNVGASKKYVYYPYGARDYSAGTRNYDMNLSGGVFTPSEYSYTVFAGDESSERVVQADWIFNEAHRTVEMNEYMKFEQEYRAFVYDAYTDIDDVRRAKIDRFFNDKPAKYINTVTTSIRAVFTSEYKYSEKSDEFSGEFVSDFFGGGIKAANSVYFATAATYVFRYYGYAARYVEGFLVNGDQSGAPYELSVTGKNAHAWTEVYFDGIGWLPIEVTPTYFSDNWLNSTVDPDNPDAVEPPEPDEKPSDPTERPDEPPVRPDEPPEPPVITTDEYAALRLALQVLIPILGTLLGMGGVVLFVAVRRQVKLGKKRKSLDTSGEAFGRAAYRIVQGDCKHMGQFSETAEKLGISAEYTARFTELIESAVYGGKDLSQNEKNFVLFYIRQLADRLCSSGTALNAFACKYLRCVGI